MSTNPARNTQAREQILAILAAAGRPMGLVEITEHAMMRPLEASTRSVGQWLKTLTKHGLLIRRGTGSRGALYSMKTETPVPKKGKERVESDSVIIRVTGDGKFKSVRAPAGMEVALEIVA